jgi:hypothetical protein
VLSVEEHLRVPGIRSKVLGVKERFRVLTERFNVQQHSARGRAAR